MDSPPKRMTRARAAAKATESTVKKTKIITPAARAKSTATASTRSTAAKRKTRADENEEDEDPAPTRKTRGRPKKVEGPEAEAPARTTRGRPAKKIATAEAKREESAPAKPTRGRPRKAVVEASAEEPAPAPVKRATRTRAASTTKPSTATRPAVKKTVKFQEPDKENLEPPPKKEPVTTGLRSRPARRGATVTRTTRATKSTATKKKPLSPKKVTQMPIVRDDSEDELAGDMSTAKPLMKSPIRLPGVKKTQPLDEVPESTIMVNTVVVSTALMPLEAAEIALGSPARRPPASPSKETMKSPAKRIGPIAFPGSALKPVNKSPEQGGNGSPSKSSLLQSAAKRPQSPIKGLNFGSGFKNQQSQSAVKASLFLSPAKRAMPTMKPLTEPPQRNMDGLIGSPTMKPFVLSTPTPANMNRSSNKFMREDELSVGQGGFDEDDVFGVAMESLEFSGRLSAILPRHADPALNDEPSEAEESDVEDICVPEEVVEPALTIEDAQEEPVEQPIATVETAEPAEAKQVEENRAIDEDATEDEEVAEEPELAATSPVRSLKQVQNPMFLLRDKDLDPCYDMDSDSEDELTAAFNVPTTPSRYSLRTPKTNGTGRQAKTSRVSMGGFDALADQLGSWRAHSPVKAKTPRLIEETEEDVAQEQPSAPSVQASPVVNNFFEDEMSVRPEAPAEIEDEAALEEAHGDVQEPSFDDIVVTEEDVALASEAHEMSLMEPEQAESIANSSTFDDAMDDTLSEDSQEYGDENDVPGGLGAPESPARGPVTPVRLVMKTFNTTTKVPLKPADDSTPSPLKKRSYSASRVAPKRSSGLGRHASTVSYTPEKGRKSMTGVREESISSAPATPAPVTPSKSDLWSSMGTPARTPRRDINPALLRGAVVYVDVYTSEGDDASSIFIELLTQMGAMCLDTWDWNPRESAFNKIGITHVVFKDGEKSTLYKVRQSGGVVQCVGVSWVLDCERENEWLDETRYNVNTTTRPRGGARRKTIEPDAMAKLNSTISSSPVKGRQARSAPSTPRNRRDSTVWMHTPSDEPEEDEEENHEWSNIMLTPVPKTPAPDAIARYVANLGPETPSAADEEEFDDSPTKTDLLTRTCPPKSNPFHDMGAGLLSQDKDEQVLMRLMAARRKSLQFAPKIGSPLSRAW